MGWGWSLIATQSPEEQFISIFTNSIGVRLQRSMQNDHISSKQMSQEMCTRDTFSIWYYFIIRQFSTARPWQSLPGCILLLHLPLKHHSSTYILLCLAASSNSSARLRLWQNKLCYDIIILPQLRCGNWLFTQQMQEERLVIQWLLQHNQRSRKAFEEEFLHILLFRKFKHVPEFFKIRFHYDKTAAYAILTQRANMRNDSGFNNVQPCASEPEHLFSFFHGVIIELEEINFPSTLADLCRNPP